MNFKRHDRDCQIVKQTSSDFNSLSVKQIKMIVSQFSEIQTTHHLNHSFFSKLYTTHWRHKRNYRAFCVYCRSLSIVALSLLHSMWVQLYFRIDIKLYRIKTRHHSHICCDKKIDNKCSRLAFIRSITITVHTMRIALKCTYKFVCHTEMTGNAQKIQCAFCCLVSRW